MCGGGKGVTFKNHNSENDTAEGETSLAYDLPSGISSFFVTSHRIKSPNRAKFGILFANNV